VPKPRQIYLVCVSASSGGYEQGRVSRNITYQPVFVLGVRIPNRENLRNVMVSAGNAYQHTRVVMNGVEFARAG